YAEGLADNINDDEERRQFYCDVIVDEAQKMNNMVKKLLTLNELEFGNSNLELSRFDIVALVKSISDSVELLAKQKNIKIVFNGTDPVYVWADEYRIEEVITNYLSNAMNHCKEPNIIDIGFNKHDNKIRVSVFNSGDIINEADISNIWDKFYKVDKARTREYGGSGIGLSIVKAIMESHYEEYGVVNHSTGVEFWFELTID
ncbi:MAG: GHKL domain-containing protein, partial [Lachnospiraceae bacterium]|nr:GHKL domain-containing protein [Lachnospiraceae bacterium]